ncbi:MAG: hypothetical protein ACK550_04920 [Synechococcaceae cyanobacterium]|jgi:hypothetical protein
MISPDPARPPQRHRGPSPPDIGVVPWVGLAQILIGTALLVLFGVMLNRSAEQTRRLERLELRLRSLENIRSLERTSALESQLRKMLARLQVVEGGNRRLIDQLGALQALLEEQEQSRRIAAPPILPAPPTSAERPGGGGEPRPERLPLSPPGLLRPPPDANP